MTPPFRGFTVTARGGLLRVLITDCHASAAFDPAAPQSQRPPFEKFQAIWDTGATNSVISQRVVDRCGLKPTGMKEVYVVGGQQLAETFLVNIGLPNKVFFRDIEVTRGELSDADMLIGMDIITSGDFSITNVGGETVFSFRVPSIATVDFVKESKAEAAKDQKRAKRKKRRASKKRPPKWS